MWGVEKKLKVKKWKQFSSSGNKSHSSELFFACPKSLSSIFSIIFCKASYPILSLLAAVLPHLTTTPLTMLFFFPLKKRYISLKNSETYVENVSYEPVGNRSDAISSYILFQSHLRDPKNPTRYTKPLELPERISGTSHVELNERQQVSSPPLPGKAMFSKISLWFNCCGHFAFIAGRKDFGSGHSLLGIYSYMPTKSND